MIRLKKMHDKLFDARNNENNNSVPKGWDQLNKQSQDKIESIIRFVCSKNTNEITIKLNGNTIMKGIAIEGSRKFDKNARISDYLKKSGTNMHLNYTSSGLYGKRETIF